MSTPARGPLLRPSRLTRTAALSLGALALGTAAAPAAWADEAGTTTTGSTSSPAAQSAPEVLTPPTTDVDTSTAQAPTSTTTTTTTTTTSTAATSSPQVAASTSTPTGAHFGTGKLTLGLTADTLPGGRTLDPTGAQLELRFSQVNGAPSTAGGICDLAVPSGPNPLLTGCTFRPGSTVPTDVFVPIGTFPSLPPNSVFTLTLMRPPTSGQLLDATMSIQGYTDSTANPSNMSDLALPVQHGYRTLGVDVDDRAPAGTQVQLCPAVAGACATGSVPVSATTDASGLATFGGRYLPGAYLVTRDGTATPFTVPAATTVTERDTALRLTLGVPVTAPPTTAGPTTASVATATVAPGREQTVRLGGFTSGETVRGTLYSTPVDLGTVVADGQGVATFRFTVPAGLELGVHTVTAAGLASGVTTSVTFVVAATPGLARTGVEVWPLLGLGALALGAGTVLTAAGGRRRRQA